MWYGQRSPKLTRRWLVAKRHTTSSSKHSSYRTADEQKRKNPGAVRIAKKRAVQQGISIDVLPSLLLLEQHLLEEGTVVEKKKVVISDNKDGTDTYQPLQVVIDIPPTVLSAFRGMMNPNKSYRFRLTRTASLVTSGSGTLSLSTGIYPSQFTQYTALALLFGESRLISTDIKYVNACSQAQTASTTYANLPIVAAAVFDPVQYGGTVVSYSDIQKRPGVKDMTSNFTGRIVSLRYKAKRRQFSDITSQGSTDPYGGNAGAWCIGFSFAGSPSTTYFNYIISAIYEFTAVR
jgi:hypothetical protein